MAYRENSESKLLEVSRGAHKLIQMIDSWPKEPNLDGRSKDITKDLLRGALDLQESMITLRKLQEASKMMSQMKQKLELGFTKERELEKEEEIGFGLTGSRRFERLAMDGSLLNCTDELKKVVGESIYSQNLGLVSTNDKKTLSSRSLRFFISSDFTAQPKKGNAPNLIAKLMGLEEFPSETVRPTRKERKDEKCLVPPRPTLDIDMPKARNLQTIEKNPELKRKTLKNIFETKKPNGPRESDQVEDCRNKSCFSETSHLELSGRNFHIDTEVPPIVIMKPQQLPCWDPQFNKIPFWEEVRSSRLIKEEKVFDNGQMLSRKGERKEVKSMEKTKVKSSQKTKTLASVSNQQQRKEVIYTRGKGIGGQKPLFNGKKPEEKKDLKAMATPKSQAKTTCGAPAKPDKRLATAKSSEQSVSIQVNAARRHNLASTSKPISRNFYDSVQVKKTTGAKAVRKSRDMKAVTGKTKCKEIGKETNQHCTLPVDKLPKQAEQDSKLCSKEHKGKDSKLFCEVMLKTRKGGRSSGSEAAAIKLADDKNTVRREAGVEKYNIKLLLLRSQSFISHAQELFGLDVYQSSYYQRKGTEEVGTTRSAKLILGFAKELMVRKSHQLELSNHPMLRTSLLRLAAVIFLDQLVEEISNGIEKLSGYSKVGDDVSSNSGVYVKLERDLRCNDMLLNAMWDLGWVNWICVEEADHVVGQVEEYILCELVEEIVVDLVY